MTKSPNSGQKLKGGVLPLNRRISLILLSRTSISLGIVVLVGFMGSLGAAWFFVQRQLAPLVERNLSETLNRPFNLGRVESFSLINLRFGPSAIPATPTDPDRLSVQAVDVAFNPIKLLLNRTLELDVTLVKPDVYIEQDSEGRWVSTAIKAQEGKGPIKTELQVVRAAQADIVLVPFPNAGNSKVPVAITQFNGTGRLLDNNQRIAFDLEGQLVKGGNFTIKGENRRAARQTNIAIAGQNMLAADISRLVKLDAVKLYAGRVDGNLEVQLRPEQPTLFLGIANFKQVTAKIAQVPQLFTNTTGPLGFKGTVIQLQNINTIYGQIPTQLNGALDTQSGYNISARTAPVGLKNLLNTFNLKIPVAAAAELQANLKVTGLLQKPVVSGTAITTKIAQIDRLNFRAIRTNFELAGSTLSFTGFQALPVVGGQMSGSGQIKLGQKGGVVFDVQAQNLPGDTLARIYGAAPPVIIGPVSAKAQVFGPTGNLETLVEFQAPAATYPGRGEVAIAPGGTIVFRNTIFQVAGGTVKGGGKIAEGLWQGEIQASDVPGSALAPLIGREVPPPLQGLLSGTFNLSGNTRSFKPETIQGSGSGRLQVAGGSVTATNVQLGNGNWRGNFVTNGVQLAGLSANIPAQLKPGRLSGNFNLSGDLAAIRPETITGTGSGRVNLPNGTINASSLQLAGGGWKGNFAVNNVQLASLSANIPAQLKPGRLSGNFNLSGDLAAIRPETITGTGSGRVNLPNGTINASSLQLAGGGWKGNFAVNNVQLASLSANIPAQLKPGRLSGNFNLSGDLAAIRPETITGTGSGRVNLPNGTINASSLQLAGGGWKGNFGVNNVQLASLSANIPAQLKPGRLSGNFNLSGSLAAIKPETITGTGSGRVNLPNGTINASSLQLAGGGWKGNFGVNNVQLASLSANIPAQLKPGRLSGNFNLSGSLAAIKPETITGTGSGRVNLPDGSITASALQLRGGGWKGNFALDDVQLASLSANIPAQLKPGRLSGNFNLSGSLAAIKPETITGTGSGRVNLPDGSITASALQLRGGGWKGNFALDDVQLASLSANIPAQLKPGRLSGNFNLSGSLAAIKPETITGTGSGRVNLPDGSITASSLQLRGGRWQGNFAANDVDLGRLAQLASVNGSSTEGTPSLQGRLSGTVNASGSLAAFNPRAIQASGQVRLENFAAEGLEFDPLLTGEVNIAPRQGVNLQLAGVQDRIEVALSPTFRPISFFVQRGEAIASGRTEGDRLLVRGESFPISILKTFAPLPSAIAAQPLSGLLSGNFDINLATRSIIGNNVEIDQPIIGTLKGDKLIGNFQYAGGVAKLTNAELQQGNSRYLLSGSLAQTANGPQFQGQLKIPNGQIQDILTALQIFELQDLTRGFASRTYGRAADIQPTGEGLPEAPLITQLRRFSEVEAMLAQERAREEDSPLPELKDLEGTFTGEITVAGSLQQGITANFDILGSDWNWKRYQDNELIPRYKLDRVIAQGRFEKGILTLLPLRIESGEGLVAFSGTVGGEQQSGQVRVQNFPVETLQDFVDLPVNATGNLNATATIAGSTQNPQARGEVSIIGGTLNQTPVQTAQGSFSYDEARLNFFSTALVSANDPIQITGSVPYKLPFATMQSASNEISVDINVQNQGLALLNLLSRGQVAWVDGQGKVDLSVRGTVDQTAGKIQQLVAQGVAVVQNATLNAQALPGSLTEVTGRVLFDFDRIQVESLQGRFSEGQLVASGVIPISVPQPTENPLTVTLNQLALNIKGRYSGGVNGNLVLTGAALNPQIGGALELVNGQVLLAETANASIPTASPASSGGSGSEPRETGVIGFNNLQIGLGKGVQITRPPVLNFLATGNLTINGTLDNIRPQGTVELERGQVNLFTTQFRLARGYPQTAQFLPNQGLIPNLDVRLIALVPETTRSRLPSNPLSTEISDVPATSLGALQSIRIEARVIGPANQLGENLELRSNPSRGEAEIVALLGGGFVETLGRGDTTLGLANLAGSALLGNVQNVIGDTLGLSEFRLFPTLTKDEKRQTATLGLGVEAGIDITPKISTSVSKVLTADDPPQYNLRYRVNDEILLRGSTDLSGDSRAVLEYENRF